MAADFVLCSVITAWTLIGIGRPFLDFVGAEVDVLVEVAGLADTGSLLVFVGVFIAVPFRFDWLIG